jgi:phosphoribosylformylglycinamidine (FGAM) synthase PurS component
MEHENIVNDNYFEYDENNEEEVSDYDILQQLLNNPNIINYSYIQDRLRKIINEYFMPKTE